MWKRLIGSAMAIAFLGLAGGAQAQDAAAYPNRPIKIIVGFTPGGANDILARTFGQKLQESLKQPVIIENKPGAGAMVATEYVARQPADGYTLLIGASGAMVISPVVYDKVGYDTPRDFVPIGQMASFPLILVTDPALKIKSVAELVDYAKKNPNKANYSSPSAAFQLVTEMFKQKTATSFQMIPYRGSNDAATAVMTGDVAMSISDPGPVSAQIAGGTVQAVAVSGPKRVAELPDVPTLREAGVDMEVKFWSGLFAPKNTPPAIVAKLEAEIIRIAKDPDVTAKLKTINMDTEGASSEQFAQIVAVELESWRAVAKSANVRLSQ